MLVNLSERPELKRRKSMSHCVGDFYIWESNAREKIEFTDRGIMDIITSDKDLAAILRCDIPDRETVADAVATFKNISDVERDVLQTIIRGEPYSGDLDALYNTVSAAFWYAFYSGYLNYDPKLTSADYIDFDVYFEGLLGDDSDENYKHRAPVAILIFNNIAYGPLREVIKNRVEEGKYKNITMSKWRSDALMYAE